MMMLLIEKTKMLMMMLSTERSKCCLEGSKDQSVVAKGSSDHMMQKMKTLKSSCSKLLMNVEKLPVTYRCITLMMLKMLSLLLLLLLLMLS